MNHKISITKNTTPQEYKASITIKEEFIPGFLQIFGVQLVSGRRTQMEDGYIQFEFNPDEESIRILKDIFNMLSGFTINEN